MGLDMYLYKAPKYKGTTIKQINAIESYWNWKDNPNAKEYTFKQWCGISENDLPPIDVQDYYKKFYEIRYYYWDDEKKFGHGSIAEEVGYWRKANAIHKWFVDNVQDGEDDCEYHEVNKEQLKELLDICKLIKDKCKLVKGKIKNGEHLDRETYQWVADYEDGQVVDNPEIAEEYLPTQSGFFFGGTDYDEYYLQDIEETIKILTNVLETTDFDTQMVVYSSSW